MPRQVPLTRKRRQWAEPRQAALKGSPMNLAPAATQAKYKGSLDSLVQAMKKEYDREIRNLIRTHAAEEHALAMDASLASQARILFGWLGKKYAKLFAARSATIVERMIDGASKSSQRQVGESLKKISGGLTIPVPDMPGELSDKITAATAENVGLIKSIPVQYHERISQTVLRSIATGGNGAQDLFEQIKQIDGVTERRAELIAVDQTRKVTTAMNVERSKAVGMRKFEWLHSGGGSDPRKLHLELDGKVFDFDNPPIIADSGERGFPGQLIHCRCTMVPILSFGDHSSDGNNE